MSFYEGQHFCPFRGFCLGFFANFCKSRIIFLQTYSFSGLKVCCGFFFLFSVTSVPLLSTLASLQFLLFLSYLFFLFLFHLLFHFHFFSFFIDMMEK